jgi:hypothetical protein
VRGEGERNFEYSFLIEYFRTDPEMREMILNLLDNPVDCYHDLIEAFDSPAFIALRNLIEFAIGRPDDANKIRDGVKFPSFLRWMLVGAKGSVSGFHMDLFGFWTAVLVQGGSKDWFLTEQNEANVGHLEASGQYASVSKFSKVFVVRVNPDDMLVMDPERIHAVVTEEDTIALGVHFLLPETLQRSICSAKRVSRKYKYLTNDKRKDGRAFYSRLLKVSLFT